MAEFNFVYLEGAMIMFFHCDETDERQKWFYKNLKIQPVGNEELCLDLVRKEGSKKQAYMELQQCFDLKKSQKFYFELQDLQIYKKKKMKLSTFGIVLGFKILNFL